MNICDLETRRMARDVGGFRPQFEEHLPWLLQKARPRTAGLSLLELAAGQFDPEPFRGGAKLVKEDTAAAQLKTNGLLRFNHRKDKVCMRRRTYYAQCVCGMELFLTAEEALALARLNAGCLQTGCSVTPVRVGMWYHPETAAALQIAQLQTLFPWRVPSEWLDMTVTKAATELLRLRDGKRHGKAGQWWFQRLPGVSITGKAPPLATRKTILCTTTPDPVLFPGGEVMINVEGEIMSTAEVAAAFSVKEDLVMKMKSQYWDRDLTDELLEVNSAK